MKKLENEMKLKGRQIDALWLFFKNDKIYKNYMKCRLCREQLYFGGLNNKQVIRSLKVHVRIKHPQKWNEFQKSGVLKQIPEMILTPFVLYCYYL